MYILQSVPKLIVQKFGLMALAIINPLIKGLYLLASNCSFVGNKLIFVFIKYEQLFMSN